MKAAGKWEPRWWGPSPLLITRDKACPILTYQQPLCFSFIPYTRARVNVWGCWPPFLLWIIFNFPPHLGWDKSRSLCGRVVRDEVAVSTFLLEFSLTACCSVYCSCVSRIPGLLMWCIALSRIHTQHRAVIISASLPVCTSTASLVLHSSTSLSIYARRIQPGRAA